MSDNPQRTPPVAGAGTGSTGAGTAGASAAPAGPDVREAPSSTPAESTPPPAAAGPASSAAPFGSTAEEKSAPSGERIDRGIADFVKRAVSAGVGAAARSKEDIVRVAATEVRSWLDHMNISEEIAKALSHMVIEVKTEIRFRPSEDGRLVPQASSDMKVKGSDS